MNFILWTIGIGEAFFVIYLVSRYLSVVIQERKIGSIEEEAQAKVQRFAS